MRPRKGLDVIDGDLPPGIGSLSQRIVNITTTLDGTEEQPEIGLISRVKELEKFNGMVLKRINLWGGVLLGAFAASGFANGSAFKAIAGIVKALGGVAGG